jgi:hypothetical protein
MQVQAKRVARFAPGSELKTAVQSRPESIALPDAS